jgi:exopolyphosphatase/guanosine-5'-triphosphate,3'-diphosphate pyrophosphatase
MRRAVIDVGSNSLLLLVAEQNGDTWEPVYETSHVTGLGKNTKRTKRLDQEGARNALEALDKAYQEAREQGAEKVEAYGTMALRIADDANQWLAKASDQGTPVKVISGDTEAELGFYAVADDPKFANEDLISIIDPGGHSTELKVARRQGEDWETVFSRSFRVGALALREGPFENPRPGFRERLAAVEEIDQEIGLEFLPGTTGRAVCLGATGVNLVTMRDGITEWEPKRIHGQILDFEEVSKFVDRLCATDDEGRAKFKGLEKGREYTIHAGTLILERFLQCLHVLDCTVSVRGWRHAVLTRGVPKSR